MIIQYPTIQFRIAPNPQHELVTADNLSPMLGQIVEDLVFFLG